MKFSLYLVGLAGASVTGHSLTCEEVIARETAELHKHVDSFVEVEMANKLAEPETDASEIIQTGLRGWDRQVHSAAVNAFNVCGGENLPYDWLLEIDERITALERDVAEGISLRSELTDLLGSTTFDNDAVKLRLTSIYAKLDAKEDFEIKSLYRRMVNEVVSRHEEGLNKLLNQLGGSSGCNLGLTLLWNFVRYRVEHRAGIAWYRGADPEEIIDYAFDGLQSRYADVETVCVGVEGYKTELEKLGTYVGGLETFGPDATELESNVKSLFENYLLASEDSVDEMESSVTALVETVDSMAEEFIIRHPGWIGGSVAEHYRGLAQRLLDRIKISFSEFLAAKPSNLYTELLDQGVRILKPLVEIYLKVIGEYSAKPETVGVIVDRWLHLVPSVPADWRDSFAAELKLKIADSAEYIFF